MPLPLLLASVLVVRQATSPPAPGWARGAVSLAIREGLLGETQYGLYPYPTRGIRDPLGLAILFREAAAKQESEAETLLKGTGGDRMRAALLRCTPLARAYVWSNAEMDRYFQEHVPGTIDVPRLAELTRQIEATSPARDRPFRDVPADHWAAKAVGDLRALGLLDGYPGETYRGSR